EEKRGEERERGGGGEEMGRRERGELGREKGGGGEKRRRGEGVRSGDGGVVVVSKDHARNAEEGAKTRKKDKEERKPHPWT
ncbi:hypothetical protein, partial [Mycobacterium tuberculosis]|uniref:hypothetical protein n=1 Tax=Mycobacterium tuberculosis TaxID=1773 RepID=UPI001BDC7B77